MKAIVAVKRVLDYNIRVHVKKDNSGIDLSNVKMSINPFDEIAIEEAVRLKEKGEISEIIAVSCGVIECQEVLRTAMAIGADRGILVEINHTEELQPLVIAKILKKIVIEEQSNIIFLGKQAIDDDCNQTGQMLAALLDWPQATFASKIEIKNKKILVTREIDNGSEILSFELPLVITTDLCMNEPRYVTLPNIIKAKKKYLKIVQFQDLKISLDKHIKTLKIIEPLKRTAGIKVPDITTLINKLKNEAKVI